MPTKAPSISRVLRGLPQAHQQFICEQYERLLPVLLRVLRPSDILERNRTWPGVAQSIRERQAFLQRGPRRCDTAEVTGRRVILENSPPSLVRSDLRYTLLLQHTQRAGPRHGVGAVAGVELTVQVVEMRFHRSDAYDQQLSDLLVRSPGRDQAQDLVLAQC